MKEYNEHISELMDDELDSNNNTINNLIKDQGMQDTWSRYHLIGDCLRGSLPEYISNHVSIKVHHTLNSEPTVLAPQKSKQINIRPLVGLAIAASVAMVAVFGIQQNNNKNTLSDSSSIALNQVAVPVTQPQSFSFTEQPQMLPAAVKKSDTPNSVANQRMNSYLVNHNEYRSNGGMNGILPYVRIVTIEAQE